MLKAVFRWTPPLAALFVLGPIAAHIVGMLRAPDGGRDVTLLLNNAPILGVVAGLAVLGIAGGAAVLATHFHGWRLGMWTAGLTLAHAAWATGTVDMIIRRERSTGVLAVFAVESLVFGLAGAAVAAAIWIVALRRHSRSQDRRLVPDASARRAHPRNEMVRSLIAPGALVGIVVAVLVGGAVAWLVGQEPLKGQAVFAAILAGIAGAGFGRLASSYVDDAANSLTFFVSMAILGALGPVAAMAIHGDGLVEAVNSGRYFGAAVPVGLDWVAGAFLGVPIGMSWFASVFERRRSPRRAA